MGGLTQATTTHGHQIAKIAVYICELTALLVAQGRLTLTEDMKQLLDDLHSEGGGS